MLAVRHYVVYKVKMRTIIIASIFLLVCSCTKKTVYSTKVFIQMGTVVTVTVPADNVDLIDDLSSYMGNLADIITSDSNLISSNSHEVEISYATYALLQKAQEYIDLSRGVFNPAVRGVVDLHGFPEGPYRLPSDAEIEAELKKVKTLQFELRDGDMRYFARGNGLKIDLGAYAKGWIVDECAQYLRERGVSDFIINAGGDLYASGIKNKGSLWRLGITDPDKKQDYLLAVELRDQALATSGIYERFFVADNGEHISHIFNALTGKTAQEYKGLSVIAANTELADLFSTVYFLLPEDRVAELCKVYETPVFLVRHDSSYVKLCGWESYEVKN